MKKKIDFSKLIGTYYSTEIKMMVLNWMIKTGKKHAQYIGRWNKIGISQALYNYSANDYSYQSPIPANDLDQYFDAIFARAIYMKENKALKEWREKESIFPNKYRMLQFNERILSTKKHRHILWLIRDIYNLNGKILKKEFAHPDYKKRTEPKILSIAIYTTGNNWAVQYIFSFKEFNYEPGWTKGYLQNENESIWEFLTKTYNEIIASVVCTV